MRIKIVLIRHPETNKIASLAGEADAPSPKGLTQLSEIEAVCRKERVEAVAYSTLPRAAVSADLLAKDLDVPPIAFPGLQERNFGKWSNRDWPSISNELNKLSLEHRYTFKPAGGESWKEMEARIQTALQEIGALEYDTVAVMTHAGPIRIILNLFDVLSKSATIKHVPGLGAYYVEKLDTSLT